MKRGWSIAVFTGCCLALFALLGNQSVSDSRATDEAAIRSINQGWFKAYNTGDVNAIVALYADDAVVNAPGTPPARGQAEIRAFFTKDIAAAAGSTTNPDTSTEVTVSGDLGLESGTFTVTDKSGGTVDRGKYLTAFAKREGKWLIIRDIWNSDGPMQAGKTSDQTR